MMSIAPIHIVLFLFLLSTQVLAAALVPKTQGFTVPFWTIACLCVYGISLWSMSYIIHSGIPLSSLMPIIAATLPLATIAVGIVFYNEAASLARVAVLVVACLLVGVGSYLK